MDSTVIAAIISVLGVGFLAMLGAFMRGVRADIAEMRADMRAEIASLRADMRTEFAEMRADIGGLRQAIARIEGIIGEHSKQLGRMADHGERITALETAAQLANA
ncbi:hypothetical protein [Candidatus Poriferisodalis sp.]|uniref:hypothetical protein n=1 Tax=Candidatus Poriferisodalis sp. TaxID=3101277 RepID=UPI003B02D642